MTALYLFTYLDHAPGSATAVEDCLAEYTMAAEDSPGNLVAHVLQASEKANHIAMVQGWDDEPALDEFISSAPARTLFHELEALLIAPADIRRHVALTEPQLDGDHPSALHVVTHVDVVPVNEDAGRRHVEGFAVKCAGEVGCLSSSAFAQIGKSNHMTLWEVWRDTAARDAHLVHSQAKSFRTNLLPLSGSPYDERLYRTL